MTTDRYTAQSSGLLTLNRGTTTSMNATVEMNLTEEARKLEELLTVKTEDIIYGATLLILGVLIVAGNLLVIVAVRKMKSLQNKMYAIIVSLAIADLLAGLAHPINALTYFIKSWNQYKALCLTIDFVTLVPLSASVFHLCAISVDRFIAVNFSLHYQMYMTRKVIGITLIFSWVASVLIGIVPVLGVNTWDHPVIPWCYWEVVLTREFLLFIGLVLLLGSAVMVTIYAQIFYIAWKQHKKELQSKHFNENISSKGWLKDMKAAKVIGVVVGAYLICWVPSAIMMVWGYLHVPVQRDLPRYVKNIVFIFAIANSMMNPLIYAWGNKMMRRTFRKILGFEKEVEIVRKAGRERSSGSDFENGTINSERNQGLAI